jgi:hypothetical protein
MNFKTLTIKEVKKLYGKFAYLEYEPKRGYVFPDPFWVLKNIRTYEYPAFGLLTVNRNVENDLYWIGNRLERSGIKIDMKKGGCFVPRHAWWNPDKPLSKHAWGIAIDINVGKENNVTPEIVEAFEKEGWVWGGYFKGEDKHHFEAGKII